MASNEGSGRRPKRSCARQTFAGPSEAMYVGYVEDNETPEMIMKKFEALDKVKKKGVDISLMQRRFFPFRNREGATRPANAFGPVFSLLSAFFQPAH